MYMYVWLYNGFSCAYVRTYVCMYACMYACMYVCMYVYVCMYIICVAVCSLELQRCGLQILLYLVLVLMVLHNIQWVLFITSQGRPKCVNPKIDTKMRAAKMRG